MNLGCFSALLFCTALLLSGCGAREPQEPKPLHPKQQHLNRIAELAPEATVLTDEALSIRGSSVAGSEQQVKELAAKFEN